MPFDWKFQSWEISATTRRKMAPQLAVNAMVNGGTSWHEDAKASQNGASHQRFVPGQPDVVIEMTPQDLRITSTATITPPPQPFRISAAEIYEMLQV